MVDKPYEKVEELYKFVNKPVTEKVTSFVDTSMSGKKASSNYNVSFAFAFFAVENTKTEVHQQTTVQKYSEQVLLSALNFLAILISIVLNWEILQVIKDSKAVSEKWRTMDVDKIRIIEKACGEFLQTFGYEIFDGNT